MASEPTSQTPPQTVVPPNARAVLTLLAMARGFWSGETKRTAWWITVGIIAFTIGNLIAGLGIIQWNRYFFDALEKKDVTQVSLGVALIFGLALFAAFCAVGHIRIRMRMQLRWRQWLSRHLIGLWLAERRFYQLNIVDPKNNPEGRIAEDIRVAVEPMVEFAIGFLNALMVSVTYISVLWIVAGSAKFAIAGSQIVLPGYMVWIAVTYSVVVSSATYYIGYPLIGRVERKNGAEADLRYELTRVRENAENIALIGGDEVERARLDERLGTLVQRWMDVIIQQARMFWILHGNTVLLPIVPLLCAAPKYLAGELTLGGVVQVAAAFGQVQIALNWFVDNAIRLAEWSAAAQRVVFLSAAFQDLDERIRGQSTESILLGDSPDGNMRIENLTILLVDGRIMLEGAEAIIAPSEKVLVKGESGTGKSTLIRAIAGLWPWGSGSILCPPGARIAFMPQRPYIPLGTLRNALLYPETDREIGDDKLNEALARCGLAHLSTRLEDEDPWDQILSGGEQQRLAFARLLIFPPDIAIMDEATAALDELSQERMLDFLRTDLAGTTVISVGHRPGLEAYHDRTITLVREEGGTAAHAEYRTRPRWPGLWRNLARRS